MAKSKVWPTSACARCGDTLAVGSTMSKFNTDQICMQCKRDERLAPNYKKADDVELAEVLAGRYNYEGIGLAPEDEAFLAARREARPKPKKARVQV